MLCFECSLGEQLKICLLWFCWYFLLWSREVKNYFQDRLLDYWISGFLDYWITGLLDYWITGLLDYWNVFRWEITFLTFSASQYIFFVSTDSALSSTRELGAPDTFTRTLGAPDTNHIEEICLSYIFLKLINKVAFLISIGKLFQLLITHKLKKFLLISRLHSVELRFILHVENLASRWAVSTDLVNHVPSLTSSCLWRIFQVWIKSPLLFFLLRWSSWPPLVDKGMRNYGGLNTLQQFNIWFKPRWPSLDTVL